MELFSLIIIFKIVMSLYLCLYVMNCCRFLKFLGEFISLLDLICMDLKFISINPSASMKLLWALVDNIT